MKRYTLFFGTLILLLSACSAPGDIEIHQAWVRPTAKGENAAVYLTLHNHSDKDDKLISASSNVTDVIEIHESKIENDIMQMNMLSSVPVAAGDEINFAPEGLHFMLVNVKQELVLGEHIGLILHFKNHEDLVVEVHIENTIPDEDHDH